MSDPSRVLLVDDHVMLRDAIRVALELAGHEVVGETGNGNEALQLVEALMPGVVVMDVTLPGMDGLEATRRVCERWPLVSVVVLTMHDDPSLVVRAVRGGASAYLTKTFSMQEVVEAVEKVGSGEVMLSPSLASSMLRELTARRDVRRALITKREEQALHLVADGYSTNEVASRLLVSDRAVREDLSSAYDKLDARATQAAFDGVRWGIISRELSHSVRDE
jgi:DNA-binding NarL/FixJ family response regulator